MIRLLSIICFIMVLGAGCASLRTVDKRVCAECGEPISGKFVEAGGSYYHPGHFVCAHCDEPIGEGAYIPYGEKQYHQSCYAGQVVVCAYCGKPDKEDSFVTYKGESYHSSCVRGHVVTCDYCKTVTEEDTFVTHDGKDYHRSCFRKQVVPCAFCGDPIREKAYTSFEGEVYHSFCYEEFVATRCAVCRELIEGEYVTDFWGGTYHPWHETDSPACDFCGRYLRTPLARGSVKYDDGRYLCGSCRASAVTTVKEVERLASDIARRLGRTGIDVAAGAVSFHMVGAREMRRLNRQNMRGRHYALGLTACREVVGVPGRTTYDNIDVYVLYGMPRVQMIAAIAHELTHVWQLIHCPLKVNLTLAEGSCSYAAYLVLREFPGGESEYIIHAMTEDNDRIYGQAFRRVRRYAEENGVASWLSLLENNGSLPQQ